MSRKRKRRKPEQVIRCLAEGESMLATLKKKLMNSISFKSVLNQNEPS